MRIDAAGVQKWLVTANGYTLSVHPQTGYLATALVSPNRIGFYSPINGGAYPTESVSLPFGATLTAVCYLPDATLVIGCIFSDFQFGTSFIKIGDDITIYVLAQCLVNAAALAWAMSMGFCMR
jgi:hypothetical protein